MYLGNAAMPNGKLYFDYLWDPIQAVVHHGICAFCAWDIAKKFTCISCAPTLPNFICFQFNHIDILCQTHRRCGGSTRKYIAINSECDCVEEWRRIKDLQRCVNDIGNIVYSAGSTYLNKYVVGTICSRHTALWSLHCLASFHRLCAIWVGVAVVRLQCNPDMRRRRRQ